MNASRSHSNEGLGFFKDSKCDMIALAMAIGAMRFVAISETWRWCWSMMDH